MTRIGVAVGFACATTVVLGAGPVAAATPFISEFHYDNDGTDTGEFVEVTADAGTDLSGWTVVLYNGNGGASYATLALTGTVADQGGGMGTVSVDAPGMQNGAPDGLALVNSSGSLIEFLSYEGSFVAVGGPADSVTSTDVGVSETSNTPAGESLQLIDGTWQGPLAATRDQLNTTASATVVGINEFSASTAGTDIEFVELFGPADTTVDNLTLVQIEGDASSTNFGQVVTTTTQSFTFDSHGLALLNLASSTLQNGTLTLAVVSDYSGETDVATNGIDSLGTVLDTVGVNDGGAGDRTYGPVELGTTFDGLSPYAPGGASRIPDATDTDTPGDWVRNNFDYATLGGSITPASGEAYNTPGATNVVYVAPPECTTSPVLIGAVQGSTDTSPLANTTVTVQGVVTGDFQVGGLNGFFMQDAGDGDATTSDGIFVYAPGADDVAAGDEIEVTGAVSEFNGLTEITLTSMMPCTLAITPPAPVELALPLPDREPYESMLVTFPAPLTIIEYFNFDRYGEVIFGTERQYQPTALYAPGSTDAIDLAASNLANRIRLDDGRTSQNPDPARHPDGAEFTLDHSFRGGDHITGLTGVLDFRFDTTDGWRIQPTTTATYTSVNGRPSAPDPGGTLQIASFNVLNYFTTLGSRGAETAEEFARQQAKIVAAIDAIDADVVGLIEIENNDGAALNNLIDALNAVAGAGTYAAINTGTIGTDEITTALIYQPASVSPMGDFAVLDSSVDANFNTDKNRPALAQSFTEIASGERFTVVVNHLKSKGSACDDIGDPNDPDGQGNCNATRTAAAGALATWMADDPTSTGVARQLIIGDLNSYDHEDPITALTSAGWTDMVKQYGGERAYSYMFDGQLGYLDYALANAALADEIVGTATWAANADEPDLIDYTMRYKAPAQDALYAPDPYRASDHDAVVVGLKLVVPDTTPPSINLTVTPALVTAAAAGGKATFTATVTASDDSGLPVSVTLVNAGGLTVLGDNKFSAPAASSSDNASYTVVYRATDAVGNTTTASFTVRVKIPIVTTTSSTSTTSTSTTSSTSSTSSTSTTLGPSSTSSTSTTSSSSSTTIKPTSSSSTTTKPTTTKPTSTIAVSTVPDNKVPATGTNTSWPTLLAVLALLGGTAALGAAARRS